MSISIGLSHSFQVSEQGSVSLTVSAVGKGVSSCIFAIEVLPNSASDDQNYRFSHVCHPAELVEYPAEAPGDAGYFRVDTITCITDTMRLATAMLDSMRADVAELAAELNLLDSGADQYGMADGLTLASALSAPLEFQFTEDGNEWHNEQTVSDTAFRARLSGLLGKFSAPVALPKAQTTEKAEKMAELALQTAEKASESAIKVKNLPEEEDFYLEKAVPGTVYRLGAVYGLEIGSVEDSEYPVKVIFKVSQPLQPRLPSDLLKEASFPETIEDEAATYELSIVGKRARLFAYK